MDDDLAKSPRQLLIILLLLLALFIPVVYIMPQLRSPEDSKRRLMLALLFLSLLPALVDLPRALRRFGSREVLLVALPIVPFLLSGALAGRLVPALDRCAMLCSLVLVALVVSTIPRSGRELLLGGIAISGALVAGFGVGEHFGWWPGLSWSSRPGEAVATFGNKAFASEFVLPAAFAALALAGRATTAVPRSICVFLHLLAVLYLGLAGTLAAIVGYAAASALALVLQWRGKREHMVIPLVTVGVGLTLLLAGPLVRTGELPVAPTSSETAQPGDPSDATTMRIRACIWRSIALEVLPAQPLLGLGCGSFDELYPPYREPEEIALSTRAGASTVVNTAHCDPLEIVAETGLLGASCAALALLVLLRAAWRARRDPRAHWILAAAVALFLGSLVRSPLLDNAPTALCFWILIGILLAHGPHRAMASGTASNGRGALLLMPLVALGAWGALRGGAGFALDYCTLESMRTGSTEMLAKRMVLDPSNYFARLYLARALARPATKSPEPEGLLRPLQETQRALEDAPYLIEAIELEAQLLFELARRGRSLEEILERLAQSRAAHEEVLALEPANERALVNRHLVGFNISRQSDDLHGSLSEARAFLALRPMGFDVMGEVLQLSGRQASGSAEREACDTWLWEHRTLLRAAADSTALALRLRIAARLSAFQLAVPRGALIEAAGDARALGSFGKESELLVQEALDLLRQIVQSAAMAKSGGGVAALESEALRAEFAMELEQAGWEAHERGDFIAVRNAFDSTLELAAQPAQAALDLGNALQVRALDDGGQRRELGLFYGKRYTIQGLELHFLAAIHERDIAVATRRWNALRRNPEYLEGAESSLDEAALRALEGDKPTLTSLLVDEALRKGLMRLDHRRRAIYRELFKGDEALRAKLAPLLEPPAKKSSDGE